MLTYKKLVRKPRAFRSMTGLDIEEFERLYGDFEYYFAETEAERLARSDRQRARGAGGQFKHDRRTRLVMTLIWLRTYPTYEVLGVLFDLDKGNISQNLKGVLPALEKVTRYDIEWPDKTRRKLQMTEAMQVFPEVFAIGDGMEQPVQRPKDNEKQKEYYSGKKKRHTVQNQVVAAPSRSLPGCSEKHHLSSQTLPSIVHIIAGLVNRQIRRRPLRRLALSVC
jgi:hypothetical protein